MGVDYRPCILPKRRALVPTRAQIADLVERVRASAWMPQADIHPRAMRLHVSGKRDDKSARDGVPIPTPLGAADVEALGDEVRFVFMVDWGEDDESDLRRILMVEEEHPGGYTMELCFARDFVTSWGNNADDGPEPPRCACGEDLSYDPEPGGWPAIRGTHVRASCPTCKRAYDPAADAKTRVLYDTSYERSAGWRDGRFPRHEAKPTEHTFTRLAAHVMVQLDFDKDWPVLPDGQYLEVDPALVRLCESVFGEPFEAINLFC